MYSVNKYLLMPLCVSVLSGAFSVTLAANTAGKAAKMAPPLVARTVQPAFSETKVLRGKLTKEVAAGEKELLAGKYPAAQEIFRQALNRNSKDLGALCGLGYALALQFKLDAADQQFTKALSLNAKDPVAHVGKAFVQVNRLQTSNMTILKQRQSILASAESECRTALRYSPDLPEGLLVLGLVQKEQGKLDAAKQSLSKSIEVDPKYSAAFVNRGLVELKQNDTASAISDFQAAIRLRSSNSTAHYGLGVAYTKTGQLDQALKELNTALSLKTNSAPTHIALGDVYRLQGNLNAAVNEYKAAIGIKAESEGAYISLSDIYQGRGDLELAAANLRGGLESSPNNVEMQLRLADITLQLGKLDDALKLYTATLNVAPSNVTAANGMTRALVLKAQKEAGGAFFVSNNFESAENLLQRAIRMNPNSMELRLADIKLRILAGKPADLNAIGTPQTDPQRLAYAEACLAECKFDEAKQAMSTVIQNCQSASDTLAVADMALLTRDLDSADAAYNKALSFPGVDSQARARRGVDAVANARTKAKSELTFATDLASKKQLASAIDKFRSAAYLNPRLADAHLGLAEALQKFQKDNSAALREASLHYKSYIALTPGLPEKEQTKISKRAEKCLEVAFKIDQGHPPSKLSTFFGPVGSFGKKVGSEIKSAFQ
ncbi:MAG: tetratricopeptide repeat protein [Candidatus Obscuribacterales bacterium]|nr:tetratricopeptide repeat protein [Candidatus Obscuribacterales bacterium]